MDATTRQPRIAAIDSKDIADPRGAYDAALLLLDTIIEVAELADKVNNDIQIPRGDPLFAKLFAELKHQQKSRLPEALQEFNSDLARLKLRFSMELQEKASQVQHPERPSLFGSYKESYLEAVHSLAMVINFYRLIIPHSSALGESEHLNRASKYIASMWNQREFLNLRFCLRTELRDLLAGRPRGEGPNSAEDLVSYLPKIEYLEIAIDGQRHVHRAGYKEHADLSSRPGQWQVFLCLAKAKKNFVAKGKLIDEITLVRPDFEDSMGAAGRVSREISELRGKIRYLELGIEFKADAGYRIIDKKQAPPQTFIELPTSKKKLKK